MTTLLIILIIIVVLYLINTLLIEKKKLASDQSIHLLYIESIKKNHHRFITQCDNYLIQSKICYPQLLHWILSFFSRNAIEKISNLMTYWVNIVAFLIFILFYNVLIPSILDHWFIFLISSLLFISIPFTFNIANAKNVGISARGMGLILGQLYTYSLVYFVYSNNYSILLVAFFACLLILMSSQFASQYILFITPLLSFYYFSFLIGVPIMLSIMVFFLMMPKIAFQFFEGNIGHKKFYFKYISDKLLLNYRYSIWGDVLYDIWKLLITKKSPSGGGTTFMYIYTNPIVILIFSLPFATPISLYFVYSWFYSINNALISAVLPFVFFSTLLFILFSFRKTRFLGEPERYVEFTIGLQVLIFVQLFENDYLVLVLILIYQVLLVIAQVILVKIRSRVRSTGLADVYEKIDALIDQEIKEEVKLLSNNTETTRLLTTIDRKVFYGSLSSEWYGKFHYLELYDTFDRMKDDMIIPVIKEFKINTFILDTKLLDYAKFSELIKVENRLRFDKLEENAHLILFHVHAQ